MNVLFPSLQIALSLGEIRMRVHHEAFRVRVAGKPRLRQVPRRYGRRPLRRPKPDHVGFNPELQRGPAQVSDPEPLRRGDQQRKGHRFRVPGPVQSAVVPRVLPESRRKGGWHFVEIAHCYIYCFAVFVASPASTINLMPFFV